MYYIAKGCDYLPTIKITTEKEYDGYTKVNSCGMQWLGDRDYNTLREKGRVDYSIYYISKGQGYYEYGGKNYTVPEGCIMLYFPKICHHYFFKKEDKAEMCWAHFSGKVCSVLDNLKADCPVVVKIKDRKQFKSIFNKMIAAHYNRLTNGDMLCDSYMPVLLALIAQSNVTENGEKRSQANEQLEKVLSRMHVDFNSPINIKDYADMCHLSEDRFIKMFKSRMGIPPYRYQLRIRIERAAEMLENSSVTVAEVGEAVGFADNAYFCRIFKKFTGHPPSFYKS